MAGHSSFKDTKELIEQSSLNERKGRIERHFANYYEADISTASGRKLAFRRMFIRSVGITAASAALAGFTYLNSESKALSAVAGLSLFSLSMIMKINDLLKMREYKKNYAAAGSSNHTNQDI
jgi:hypothetical protein